MSAHIGTWVRVKPSGHVHYVIGVSTDGIRTFACGVRYRRSSLTDRYPSEARRCIECEDLTDPEDEDA